MKQRTLNNTYLSLFCAELAMLLDAGLTVSDGIQILHDDESAEDVRAVTQSLYDSLMAGKHFSAALADAGVFPRYMVQMVEVGERTGRLVQTLNALSEYYERQTRLADTIRSSVLYPAVLLVLMIAVVLVLIMQVLPMFNDIYARLGTQMSAMADAMMRFGGWLGDASIVIAFVTTAILLFVLLLWIFPSLRRSLATAFSNKWGNSGIFGKIASSRFIFAMTLTMASGFDTLDAINLASGVSGGSRAVDDKHKECVRLLDEGKTLPDALRGAGILSLQDAKMLSVGSVSGKADLAMAEIARRSDIAVQGEIDSLVGKIEPTLVIISSVIVGVILLSVMLPLMGIMTAIG